ncbi:hypothetical protein GCM10008908_35500 [Clostridium subterminale]|uniref:ATPase dynein-related AAA domain-containing protein n=1 Tax=Clostridium subterminale TaxID=1550 RepID=A0ABN1KXL8_CLOSU
MNITDVKNDIQTILGQPVTNKNVTSAGNGVYEYASSEGKYIFAMIGASGNTRLFAQMQANIKPRILSAYESSKKDQDKFFLMVPDSSNFSCDDFYIFIELLDKGGTSSSFEIKIPSTAPQDRITRCKGSGSYFVTYVPAKDTAGAKSIELLKQYILCFDSRPYSKYITKITDFLPNNISSESSVEMIANELWPNNFLIAGAPGTGKSYMINEHVLVAIKKEIFLKEKGKGVPFDETEADRIIQDLAVKNGINEKQCIEIILKERVRRVTFYEDYSYENFVGCYKPIPIEKNESHSFIVEKNSTILTDIKISGQTSGSQITYAYEAGVFIKTYIDAINNADNVYFLIIEEINRARAATVFGDMFQLLDRENGVSEYYITPETSLDNFLKKEITTYDGIMKLPANMFIWATMNNADQGVFPLDAAFKRRWGYLYLDVNSSNRDGDISIAKAKKVRWNIFRNYLNAEILEIATEDKCIGAWYFKSNEFKQIEEYYNTDERDKKSTMLNPLTDKLIIYLLNDVCRMNPSALFKEEYLNMPSIRTALLNAIGLEEILNVDWTGLFEDNDDWIERQKQIAKDDADSSDGTEDNSTEVKVNEVLPETNTEQVQND